MNCVVPFVKRPYFKSHLGAIAKKNTLTGSTGTYIYVLNHLLERPIHPIAHRRADGTGPVHSTSK